MKKADFKDWIIQEDEDYIFINKPPFFASLEDRAQPGLNLNTLAKQYWPDAQLCHRLDKETSGVLAIAKHPEAYRHLSMQFEHRQVAKRYHAVVGGLQDLDGMVVNLPISPSSNGSVVHIDKAEGKQAETIFFTLKVYKNHTLVECMPITGRMHQIRIHLSCLDAPIIGDPQYGGKEIYLSDLKRKFNLKKDTEELPLIKRVALHAYSLSFKNLKEEQVEIIAEYPKDFKVLVKKLEELS
jgi:23S rRNA pseudouridine955/2504/2580 synthase